MSDNQNTTFSKKNRRNIIVITLIFLIFTAVFTLAQPLKYRSSCRLLLIQEISANDQCAASKSAAHLSDIFAEVVYSASFLDEVINSGFNINKNYFKTNEQRKKKQWGKMISAKTINETGILEINIFHEDKNQAEQIANAASYILKTKHILYHGRGDNFLVKIIDKPITSNWPVKPNILVNFILALIFGIIFGIGFIYYFPDYDIDKYLVGLFRRNKRKKTIFHNHLDNGFTKEEELHDRFDKPKTD